MSLASSDLLGQVWVHLHYAMQLLMHMAGHPSALRWDTPLAAAQVLSDRQPTPMQVYNGELTKPTI